MLGMMFGVGAVIAMLSIGAGAERQALRLIDKLGVRNVVVRAKEFKPDELAEVRKKSLGLSPRDVAAIKEAVPGAELIVPRLQIDAYKILSRHGKTEGKVYGVSHLHAKLVSLPLEEGRFIDARDDDTHAQVCVIGSLARRDLAGHGKPSSIGEDVKVNDVWCEVVGVLAMEGDRWSDAARGLDRLDRPRDLLAGHDRHPEVRAGSAQVAARRDRRSSGAGRLGPTDRGDHHRAPRPSPWRRRGLRDDRAGKLSSSRAGGRGASSTSSWGRSPGSPSSSDPDRLRTSCSRRVLELDAREIGVRHAVGALVGGFHRFQFLVNAFTLSFLA